ncbi:M48 family metalloprotease [Aestuariirhabdus sp. Z084]|uniref:M48 family metalloprotease n=1 Tax=Aestuariirhabdus haliotis TaxID=2918751 RepID=UPI00201B3CFF|nr:M48 family metalloprotease [Aestuariirhabdus haliotis]MCL6414958.1 M48 family metalloprotease [Aestuariirhabdus haliotis]MCL6418890.1 M48 family metalloprotease [Aestuariirhabdus haliotis]
MPVVLLLRCLAVIVSMLWLGGCAVNPATGDHDFVLMTEDDEISMGRKYNQKIRNQYPIYEDQKLQQYVQEIGQRVARNSHRSALSYQFTVIDTPDINAFALPGGFIYVHRGLMAYLNSEAELAAVLAHEVGHVTARHSVRQHSMAMTSNVLSQIVAAYAGGSAGNLSNIAGTALVRGYGRDHELEADGFGAEYLANSGYNPQAMIEVVEVLKNQETFAQLQAKESGQKVASYHGLFSTHPSNDQRLQEVVGRVPPRSDGRVGREDYLKMIDGMAFGNSAAQGIVDGRHFLHKSMDLKVTFPEGWKLQNQPDQLVAIAPEEKAFLLIQLGEIKNGYTPVQYLREMVGNSTMRQGQEIKAKGYSGYSAIVDPRGKALHRVAVIYYQGKVFELIGSAKKEREFDGFDQLMQSTIASFRKLPKSDYDKADGLHLRRVKVRKGDNYARLAKRSPISQYAEQQLRLINDQYPTGQPSPGEWVKLVY